MSSQNDFNFRESISKRVDSNRLGRQTNASNFKSSAIQPASRKVHESKRDNSEASYEDNFFDKVVTKIKTREEKSKKRDERACLDYRFLDYQNKEETKQGLKDAR